MIRRQLQQKMLAWESRQLALEQHAVHKARSEMPALRRGMAAHSEPGPCIGQIGFQSIDTV